MEIPVDKMKCIVFDQTARTAFKVVGKYPYAGPISTKQTVRTITENMRSVPTVILGHPLQLE